MSNRICIVTNFRKTSNYGGILQAYALNRYLRNEGYYCETLNYAPQKDVKRLIIKNVKNPGLIVAFVKDRFGKLLVKDTISKRKISFDNFRNEYIPHTKECNQNSAQILMEEFDTIICGSDQIWRPGAFDREFDPVMWLSVFDGKYKKVSYAASMGTPCIDSNDKRDFIKKSLAGFQYLSVREDVCRDALQPLVPEVKIEKVIDPVFLIGRDEWRKFANSSNVENKIGDNQKYIFAYFIQPNHKIYSEIKELAEKTHRKIILFPYMSYKFRIIDFCMQGEKIIDASPMLFLKYIEGADYVITDSFHATAFSIIFQKKFASYATNHSSRICELLSISGLEKHLNGNLGKVEDLDDSWENVNIQLYNLIEHSKSYLRDALL